MLKEIHTWWARNLKEVSTARNDPVQADQDQLGRQGVTSPITFETYIQVTNGVPQLLCPKTCLHDDWREARSVQLFLCRCGQVTTSRAGPAHPRLEAIAGINLRLRILCFQ